MLSPGNPLIYPIPSGPSALHPKGSLVLSHCDDFHTWTMGLRLTWNSPGWDPSSKFAVWNSVCFWAALGLWRWILHGPLAPVMGWELLEQALPLVSPHLVCCASLLGSRWDFITYPAINPAKYDLDIKVHFPFHLQLPFVSVGTPTIAI